MPSVYVIQAESGPIKIGLSQSIDVRLEALQTAHYENLYLICLLQFVNARECAELEMALHRKYKSHRLKGEWFSVDVVVVLKELCRYSNFEYVGPDKYKHAIIGHDDVAEWVDVKPTLAQLKEELREELKDELKSFIRRALNRIVDNEVVNSILEGLD